MPKQLSGAAKRKKRKLNDQFIESQKGALNKYFTTVDANSNHQRQEDESGEDDVQNSNANVEVNDQPMDDESKFL